MPAFPTRRFLLPVATLATVLAAAAAPAQENGNSPGSAPVSSGMKVTGHGGARNGARSKVSPSHPAPAEHVTQPSSKLRSDPNVEKEQVAPVPAKPVPAPGAATTAPNNPGG